MKKLVILFILLIFAQSASATKYTGLREISPKVEIFASLNKDPKDKNTGVDSNFYKFNMKVEMPESVRSGDYFNVELRGIPSSDFDNMDIRANDKEKTKIGRVFKVDENINARDVQFAKDHPLFNLIKPEQSGDWRKFQFIFDENVEKIKNIKFEIGFENKYQGFAVANRSYEVPIFVKVGGEDKYGSTAKIGSWPKHVFRNSLHVHDMVVDGDMGSYKSDLTTIIGWKGDMIGRKIQVSIDGDSKIVLSGVSDLSEGDIIQTPDGFMYNDTNIISSSGLIGDNIRGVSKFKILKISDRMIEFEVVGQSADIGFIAGFGGIKFELDAKKEFFKTINPKTKIKYVVKNGSDIEYSEEYDVNIKVKNNTYKYSDEKDSARANGDMSGVNDWVLPIVGVLMFLVISGLIAYVALYISKNSKRQ